MPRLAQVSMTYTDSHGKEQIHTTYVEAIDKRDAIMLLQITTSQYQDITEPVYNFDKWIVRPQDRRARAIQIGGFIVAILLAIALVIAQDYYLARALLTLAG